MKNEALNLYASYYKISQEQDLIYYYHFFFIYGKT